MNSLRTSIAKSHRGKWLFLALGLLCALAVPLRAAVLFSDNFNSYADATAFAGVYNLSAGSVVIGATGGLGGSQSVQTTTATAVRTNVINTGLGAITMDLYFQWGGPFGSGAARPQIGLVNTTSGAFNGSSDLSARIGGGNVLELRAQGAGAGSDTVIVDTFLTNNYWYLMRFTISQTASSGVFSNTIAIYNSDTSGVVGTLVRAFTNSALSNPSYYNQSTTYAAFRNTVANPNLDNFSVSQTPPPSATIAIAGALDPLFTIAGTASSSNSFTISGVNLTGAPGNLTVTPPAGFEVSRTNDSAYSTNHVLIPYSSATLAGTSVYVRLAATTPAGTYSGSITVAGGGDSKTIATAASTVYPTGSTILFTDDYTISVDNPLPVYVLDAENTNSPGRQTGSLFPLPYQGRYTGAQAYKQRVGDRASIPADTNALILLLDAGVRVEYDFSTNGAPLEIRWSVIFNNFGQANTNTFIVGNLADDYDPTNAAFAFQIHNDGTTTIFDHGVEANGAYGASIADNILVPFKVILSDTNGTGSAFGSGGSKAAYYQNGVLLGTATLGQLTAGQGYLGFVSCFGPVGGNNPVGIDNLRITALPASASPTPTNITYTVSGGKLILNWPAGQGWLLQSQTNNLNSGLGTNWSTITGATPPYTNNVNPANPTVFYRLKY